MSIKSSSRFSANQQSQISRPSMLRTPRVESGTRPRSASAISLLWANRVSAAFRVGKAGYKVPRYQNSYRLGPYNPFKPEIVDKILKDVLNGTLTGMKYNSAVCLKLCQDMSAEVRSRIYKKDFDRYKYIVSFTICEKTGQAINMAMGRIWDVERDTYSTHCFENSELIAVGTVYGIYYE